jgi:hypothetical protein
MFFPERIEGEGPSHFESRGESEFFRKHAEADKISYLNLVPDLAPSVRPRLLSATYYYGPGHFLMEELETRTGVKFAVEEYPNLPTQEVVKEDVNHLKGKIVKLESSLETAKRMIVRAVEQGIGDHRLLQIVKMIDEDLGLR